MFADEELQRSRFCDMKLEVGRHMDCRLQNGMTTRTHMELKISVGKLLLPFEKAGQIGDDVVTFKPR
jgi:hypothetical protein